MSLPESLTGIPHVIHFVHGDELNQRFVPYVQSWINHHPTWKFKSWTEAEGRELIANRLVWPCGEAFRGYHVHVSLASFIDDYICLRLLSIISNNRVFRYEDLLGMFDRYPYFSLKADFIRYGIMHQLGGMTVLSFARTQNNHELLS